MSLTFWWFKGRGWECCCTEEAYITSSNSITANSNYSFSEWPHSSTRGLTGAVLSMFRALTHVTWAMYVPSACGGGWGKINLSQKPKFLTETTTDLQMVHHIERQLMFTKMEHSPEYVVLPHSTGFDCVRRERGGWVEERWHHVLL